MKTILYGETPEHRQRQLTLLEDTQQKYPELPEGARGCIIWGTLDPNDGKPDVYVYRTKTAWVAR